MYQCCIFDLDGTLINSIHALTHTINLTLEEYGLGPVDEEHTKIFVGDGYKKFVERALVFCGDTGLGHYQDALAAYERVFEKNCLYHLAAYDGIKELLQELKNRNIRIAVLSNKAHERTVENIEAVFGNGYFDVIAGEKPDIRRKPDPTGVFKILEELGIDKQQCLYLGDTSTDMKTGINAGVDTVGVTWGFRDRSELEAFHPRYIVNHPGEIIGIIEVK